MIEIDLLFLDLASCTRCRGADRRLEQALEVVGDLLAATGTEVEVNRIHVESAAQARELRFESSPTIRINGHDVALERRESACGSEACADGSGDQIACRVWVHDGGEHTEPPVAMIADAILREVYAGAVVAREIDSEPYALPQNLERFFAGKVAAQTTPETSVGECCSPGERRSCCDPRDKAECCGAAGGEGCGCR